jgi:hypothetical protein
MRGGFYQARAARCRMQPRFALAERGSALPVRMSAGKRSPVDGR